jgi:hypothetical protein
VFTRGDEQVQRAVHVRRVARERVLERERHRNEARLVQDEVNPVARLAAERRVVDRAGKQVEARPRGGGHARPHVLEILQRAGGKIVQPHDRLAEFQQRLQQVRADEARAAGDEPSHWSRAEGFESFGIGHFFFVAMPKCFCKSAGRAS